MQRNSNSYTNCNSDSYSDSNCNSYVNSYTYGYGETYTNPEDRSHAKSSADARTAAIDRANWVDWRGNS